MGEVARVREKGKGVDEAAVRGSEVGSRPDDEKMIVVFDGPGLWEWSVLSGPYLGVLGTQARQGTYLISRQHYTNVLIIRG